MKLTRDVVSTTIKRVPRLVMGKVETRPSPIRKKNFGKSLYPKASLKQ